MIQDHTRKHGVGDVCSQFDTNT